MKKFSYMILLAIGLLACTGNNNNQQMQPQQAPAPTVQQQPAQTPPADAQAQAVPEAINAFVKQYFPNATIAGVEPDNDHGGVEYDVHLNDGTEVDFDANNQWETIESRAKGVPAAFIPQAIATYVKSNYQNMAVAKIHKEHYGYEIELTNGLELNFDQSGQFMGMDD